MPVWNHGASGGGGGDPVTVSGIEPVVDELTVGSPGQTAFTLSGTPDDATDASLFLNGVRQRLTDDFTISGTSLTWVSAYSLDTDDDLSILYFTSS